MSQAQLDTTPDGYVFRWPDQPITLKLSRIKQGSQGTSAELQALYTNGTGKSKTLAHQTLNLLTSKTRLAKDLQIKHDAPWLSMLEQVCVLALRELRKGAPIESLEPGLDDRPSWFVLNPLLYEKNPTVLYGPGDSLKSLFALWCGMLLASGVSACGLACAPDPWKVLFLDWEMSAQDLRGRVKLLQAGDARLTTVPDYRRCYQPLVHDVEALKTLMGEAQYDVLILDSLAMAAGGQELERADSAIQFNAALRTLNCTSLVIGHTPKPREDQTERSLYGSVFFHNLCRVSWECRREGQTIGLFQRKNNLGPHHDPMGFAMDLDETRCLVTTADLMDAPELSEACPLKDRLTNTLRTQPMQTAKELAQNLNVKLGSVRAKLHAYPTVFSQLDGKWECRT